MTTPGPRHDHDHDPARLRQLRREKGLTLAEVAERAGVSRSTVARAERAGERYGLRVTTLRGIADSLGCRIKDLMRHNGDGAK